MNRAGFNTINSIAVGSMILVASSGRVCAETLTFNFDDGVEPEFFSTFNSSNLWTLNMAGPNFRVSKPAEDGSVDPHGFISGGIKSRFAMTGDFLVTVDFTHLNFPAAGPHPNALNESVLSVNGNTNGEAFLVLRFQHGTSGYLEAFANSTGPIGLRSSSLASGRYQIERTGDTLTGRFAPSGSDVFTTLGSLGGQTSPQFYIQLSAVQGLNADGIPRSNTALDIAFDNLIVEADGFVSTAPPLIQSVTLAGADVIINGTNGFEGNDYYVLTSTNVALARTNWTSIATNSFGVGGGFTFTNTITSGVPQRFFMIQMP